MSMQAEKLLHEIQSESLQQLLVSLQPQDSQLQTGISAFDSCLFKQAHSCLRWGDRIHIQGPSGSGKTQLLYLLLVACCLPHRLGGWDKVAFVFDVDGTFDIGRFREVLIKRLRTTSVSVETITDLCLDRVHVFRPASTEQLAATLSYLPKYHSINFPEALIGMLAIHSIEAFHWVDQFKLEHLRASSTSRGSKTVYQNIFTSLDSLRRSYGAIEIISHWGLLNFGASSGFERVPSAVGTNQPPDPSQLFRIFYLHLGGNSEIHNDDEFGPIGLLELSSD